MGQWTRVENSNEVLLQATNHTGQAEKNPPGPSRAGWIFLCLSGVVRRSEKHLIAILHPSSLSHNN